MHRLVRPLKGRMIAGVCQGIADRFGCSVVPVRVLWVGSTVFFGVSILMYLLFWILMPDEH
ncbi:PspC domain-containing protein [Microbacterium sp. NPDC058062]|uniref:PspC domain-containing protein n=1 Tax=Microbacterium sp. NPDC058062 TaxID=3346320 RepID=UPI0036DC067D